MEKHPAVSLMEFSSIAGGILAVDHMLKRAPIAVLKCGTVHPGRYLVLVGGTVASVEEAWIEGCRSGGIHDDVFLPDPHPDLLLALTKTPVVEESGAMAVLETSTSPALLRAVDAVLKAVPIHLATLRLADDLGGNSLAIVTGGLTELQTVLEIAPAHAGPEERLLAGTLMPRVEEKLLEVIAEGTRFDSCRIHEPAGAEVLPLETGE